MINVNEVGEENQNSVIELVRSFSGDNKQISELLKKCRDINETDSNGNNALFYTNDLAVLNALLEAGIDVDHVNNEGNTMAWHYAYSVMNHVDERTSPVIDYRKLFYAVLAYIKDINYQNKKGQTLLHYMAEEAICDDCLWVIKTLIMRNHPDTSIKDQNGNTPGQIIRNRIEAKSRIQSGWLPRLLPFLE